MLPTRAWEFLIGTLLALQLFESLFKPKIYHFFSITGFGLIMASVFMLSATTLYPSYYALFPVLGASLLIYSGENYRQSLINKFLAHPLFVFIGKISYSLYLWHWVLYVFYLYFSFDTFSGLDTILLLVASLFLSFLSWRFIEQPFRHSKKNTITKGAFKLAFIGSSILLLGGLLLIYQVMPWRVMETNMLSETLKDPFSNSTSQLLGNISSHPDTATIPIVLGNQSIPPQLIIWGDSHAHALGNGLNLIVKENNSSLYMATASGCPGLQYIDRVANGLVIPPKLSLISERVLQFIISHPEIKTVVLVGRWAAYAGNAGLDFDAFKLAPTNKNWDKYKGNDFFLFEKGLRETIYALKATKKKIILVTDVPQLTNSLSRYLVKKRYSSKKLNDLTPKRIVYESDNKKVIPLFQPTKERKFNR